MCGRFAQTLPNDTLARFFAARPDNDLPPTPNYNICPTDRIATIAQAPAQEEAQGPARRLRAMRWGFVPVWYKTPDDGPLLINARAETLATKTAFRAAARARRCIVPASGFYEWSKGPDGGRLPWYVTRRDGSEMALAGIWQHWKREGEALTTCTLVTTRANRTLGAIHSRMPVILEPADWGLWLGEAGIGAAVLMHPPADDVLHPVRVSRAVNSCQARGPALIAPLVS